MHVKNILAAPRGRIRRVIARSQFPLSFTRHRIDRNMPEIDFSFRNLRVVRSGFSCGEILVSATSQTTGADRQDIHALHQRLQIWWITIRIVGGENGLIGNRDAHARIGKDVRWLAGAWAWAITWAWTITCAWACA